VITGEDKRIKGNKKDNKNLTVCIIFNTPPQTVQSPSALAKCLALTDGNALVSVSAVMLLVGQ